jgi:hypothetical protein
VARTNLGTILACVILLAACSSGDQAESGFNQVIENDGAVVNGDAFVPTPDVPFPDDADHVAPDSADLVDLPPPDVADADAKGDAGDLTGDGGDGEVATVDGLEDLADSDVAPDLGPDVGPDVDPIDATDTKDGAGDGGDGSPDVFEPQCLESADCLEDFEAMEPCATRFCIEGLCVDGPAKAGIACDLLPEETAGGCVVGTCDGNYGCLGQIVADIPCDDDNPCTIGEACDELGACSGGGTLICAPPGPCQASVCDAGAGGCVPFPSWEGQPCNDEDPCTEGTQCAAGACGGGENLCSCESDADCPNDEDECNGVLVCSALEGGGKGCQLAVETVVVCPVPDNPCLTAACEPATGECLQKTLAGSACEDGDLCTVNDVCDDGGTCVGDETVCEDEDPCTSDACSEATGACLFEPSSGLSCSDGDPCTTGDACNQGTCVGSPKLCDDGNGCTVDACDGATGTCASEPALGAACDDENACTDGDACDGDGTCGGEPISCEDENPCTGTNCEAAIGCVFTPLTIPCDDGNACTGPDVCKGGICDLGPISCDDAVACTGDWCDEETGCGHEADNGACDDGNPCTEDICDAVAGCIHTPLSEGACEDGNACTVEDACVGGACVGLVADCDDGFACTLDGCEKDDGCVHQASAEVCDDGNPCTDDFCSYDVGCVSDPNDVPCEDGNPCTDGDACSGGVCAPGENSCDCGFISTQDLYWSAEAGDGEAAFYDIIDETFNSLDNGQDLQFSDNAASLTGASLDGQVVSYTLQVPFGLAQPEVVWHLGGASIENSAVFLFWEDEDGAFHDLYCADDGLSNVGWDELEAGQIPYPCANSPSSLNVEETYAFTADQKPLAIHLRFFIHAVPTGDTFYIYELGFPEAIFPSPDCDDADLCNGIFSCLESPSGDGACSQVQDPIVCGGDTGDACTVSACNPDTGLCEAQPAADGTLCPDANPCTTGEVCLGGACIVNLVGCDDSVSCTVDQCDPESGGCTHAPLDPLCNDFVPCTDNTCDPTQGCVFTPGGGSCDDANPCTDDQCDPIEGCSHTPNDAACDDGVSCTVDTCDLAQGCVFDPEASQCADGNPCTNDLCLGGQGCVYEPNNGQCEDGNPCTQNDICDGGDCQSGAVKPCESGNVCKVGACEAATGECAYSVLPNGTACEDGDVCTNPDTCSEALCASGPVDGCDDGVACTIDACEPGEGCVHTPWAEACDDSNPCTIDVCDPEVGCEHLLAPDFHACSDGLEGTGPDVCVDGKCLGFQTTEIIVQSDWWCQAVDGLGRALGVYGGQLFAIVNYSVEGLFCEGERSQVFGLDGAAPPTAVPNSSIGAVLSSIAFDGVFAESGEVGQFAWGVGSISYFFGDLVSELENQGGHYAAWAGHLKDGEDVDHVTYVVGEHDNGKKGKIERCVRTNDDEIGCDNIDDGLKNGEKEYFRPVAVHGAYGPDPDCDEDACDDVFYGVAMVSNDTDGLTSVIWGDDDDKLDYAFVDNANQLFDVHRVGESSIWISGNQGHLSHFDGDGTWIHIDGPESMAGLDLRALGRISGHLLVAGHWLGAAGGEAFLFVLPAGANAPDPLAWVTVPLGDFRQVHAIHTDGSSITISGRQYVPGQDPTAFLWYLSL